MKSNTLSSSPEVYSNLLAAARALSLADNLLLAQTIAKYFNGLNFSSLSNPEQKGLWNEYLASKEECVITEDNWNQE